MKNIFVILFLLHGVLFGQDLKENLLLHYNFNNNSQDHSGNDFHGINKGAENSVGALGLDNTAFQFDGVNDYIEIPDNGMLKPLFPVTFSAYIYVDETTSPFPIVRTDISNDVFYGCFLNLTDHLNIEVGYGSGNLNSTSFDDRRIFVSDDAIKTNNWYLIVGILRGKDDMEIWVDGVKKSGVYKGGGTNTEIVYNPSATSAGIAFMDYATLEPYYFFGKIDDVRIWNKALNSNEISLLTENIALLQHDYSMQKEIFVYPNPAINQLNIKIETDTYWEISVFNSIGKLIRKFEGKGRKIITIDDLDRGVYSVIYNNGIDFLTEKVIINN